MLSAQEDIQGIQPCTAVFLISGVRQNDTSEDAQSDPWITNIGQNGEHRISGMAVHTAKSPIILGDISHVHSRI